MTEPAVHFPEPSPAEQRPNPVQTGFDLRHAFDFLEKAILTWKKNEYDRRDVLVLRAICRLSLEKPEQALEGFSSPELVETVIALTGRPWSSRDDKEKMSDDVRKAWKKLAAFWDQKVLGLRQGLADEGIDLIPSLERFEGGGTGNLSRYAVQWVRRSLDASTVPGQTAAPSTDPNAIRYICEDIADPGFLARAFAKGYRLAGWRRWLLILALAGPLLFGYLLFVLVLYGMAFSAALGAASVLKFVGGLAVIFFMTWLTIGPILVLPTRKIVLAPWWLHSSEDDRLLEHRASSGGEVRSIKAVTYTAICPVCGGKVTAKSGGLEFLGRVAGRCENAPIEHVFSFDHVTRRGKSLR